VFGYPIEMLISGNTLYALLRYALDLTQVGDKLQFQRHNVSQLVVINVYDFHRNFNVVGISATANALMVVENACEGEKRTQNTFKSWDVSDRGSLWEVAS
jgi:hypothetical protein